jgi:hypothetical protein
VICQVAFAKHAAEYFGQLCYFEGIWRKVSESGDSYHIAVRQRWFRAVEFSIFKLEGADTAAIGGGACWFARVTEWTTSEVKAIKEMAGEVDDLPVLESGIQK